MTTDQAITEALAEDAAERATQKLVRVSSKGVQFGRAWFSHEGITGNCAVAGNAYMEWLSEAPAATEAELRQQLAEVTNERDALRAAAAGQWREGSPTHPWDSEWFLADVGGSYAVLRPLPEEYTYDFTTADATYFMRYRVKRWAQLSDSNYVPPADEVQS